MTSRSTSLRMTNQMESFALLHPVVQHHVINTLGWDGLRPPQAGAIAPVLAGDDCLLLAPTAGGKTEAALLPMLTRMADDEWSGLSVLYICPLKALLNNLEPRIASYASWVGHSVSVRHGDTPAGVRQRQALQRPSILLTTPESLEAMLVSRLLDETHMFADVRAVIVDEVHAFAGDDRGWHLLSVLERITKVAGRPLQRIGLSATVGNPEVLLEWLQGTGRQRSRSVVAPPVPAATPPELALDYVGSVPNAATVVAGLHRGEKRLVFADSRRTVESLAAALGERDVDTYVSHSSLSLDERRRAEAAFASGRDCVIVSTSTLELGIDVGDLDRVLQLGAPGSVSSVLQRLGRTGRRAGAARNLTFLAVDDDELLRSTALLLLLEEGYVEPVEAPPSPLHVAAQQHLGLALQKGRVYLDDESSWMSQLGLATSEEIASVTDWLVETGHLDIDQGLAFVGPQAEQRFGRRNFMDLLAVFTAAPEVRIVHGRREVGSVDPLVLVRKTRGPRIIALAGRAWHVTHIDWRRRRAYVEPSELTGRARWTGPARAQSFALSDAIRRVLLGATPTNAILSTRAAGCLEMVRANHEHRVDEVATVVAQDDGRVRWWTFAGLHSNAVLAAALDAVAPELLDEGTYGNLNVSLRSDAAAGDIQSAMRRARAKFGDDLGAVVPQVSEQALKQLKFSELLPPELAARTLGDRGGDHVHAARISSRRVESSKVL